MIFVFLSTIINTSITKRFLTLNKSSLTLKESLKHMEITFVTGNNKKLEEVKII
jgi:hypothetical protein